MALTTALRICTRGVKMFIAPESHHKPLDIAGYCRSFSTSTAYNGALDYFRARRGPFTPEEKRGSNHLTIASTHWKLERAVAVVLVGIMPTALFVQGPLMDHVFCTFVYLHGHWGMKAVLTDYLEKFVPWIQYVWYTVSILGFAGLIHFNVNDVGFTKAVQMLWSL